MHGQLITVTYRQVLREDFAVFQQTVPDRVTKNTRIAQQEAQNASVCLDIVD